MGYTRPAVNVCRAGVFVHVNQIKHSVMNLKYFFSLLACLMFSCGKQEYKNQKSVLVFKGQYEYEVRIYKPIDGMYNFGYVSDILNIPPSANTEYEVEIDDFGCVQLRFTDGSRYLLLLEQGDRVEVNYESSKIKISGSNAEGHNYLRDNYTSKGLGTLYGKIEPILRNHISTESVNCDSINGVLWRELILPYREDIKKMVSSGSISSNYAAILDKTLYTASIWAVSNFYNNLLFPSGKIFGFKPSQTVIQDILIGWSKLYEVPDVPFAKLPYFYPVFYEHKYKYSDAETIEQTIEKYGKDCFGAYPQYLFHTDSMQLREYGSLFIEDLQNRKFSFNL